MPKVSIAILFSIAFFSFIAPFFYTVDPIFIDKNAILLPPSFAHLFGTDRLGRDVLARTMQGGQVSLIIGIGSAFIASFVSQVAAEFLYEHHTLYISLLLSFIIGYLASFTKLKEVNGSEDIATTMLYLLSAVLGMRIFEGDYSL